MRPHRNSIAALVAGASMLLAFAPAVPLAPIERLTGEQRGVAAHHPGGTAHPDATLLADPGQPDRRLQPDSSDDTSDDPATVLYLWTGDHSDIEVESPLAEGKHYDVVDDRDFLAVVDADPDSPTYGKVLRTVSVETPPGVGNEPHHMQPFIPPGCTKVFAGGLFSDYWFTFDVSDAARPEHTATLLPTDTRGTVPDAAFVLPNCEALATEMGGDPTTLSYPGGPHGTVVRLSRDGTVVRETQEADRPQDRLCEWQWNPVADPDKTGGPFTRKTSERECLPSNPHGIWARPDLNVLVTSDYATPGQLIQAVAPTSSVAKLTVRHYPLDRDCTGLGLPPRGTDCVGEPTVVLLPDGPRVEANEGHEENVGVMETATTNAAGALNPTGSTPPGYLPSKGGFATTMCGGALFYTPDIAADRPQWREVFDFTAALAHVRPDSDVTSGCTGGGAVVVTPDNRFVLHSIVGRDDHQEGALIGEGATGEFPGMIVLLDVAQLIRAGTATACSIDEVSEVRAGGAEADCPRIADVHLVDDRSSGGPHFLSLDYGNGAQRLAFFNYFVGETGIGGNLDVCILNLEDGELVPDGAFPAAVDGQEPGRGCISFDRQDWPDDRGAGAGPGKPHYGLFRNTG